MALIPLNPPAPESLVRRRVWNLPAALKFWHLASLDAPTVAVTWACAYGWAAGFRLPVWPVAVLGLLVWAIYVADRLLDARAGLGDPARHLLQERHSFHWRNRRLLAVLSACAAAGAAWMIWAQMPAAAVRRDSWMGLATLAYMSNVHARGQRGGWLKRITQSWPGVISRECVVGVIFSAGCLLPALARSNHYGALAAPAVAFAAVAWLNVSSIGKWESGALSRKAHAVRGPALMLGCGCLVAAVALATWEPRGALLVAAAGVSSLLLAALDARAKTMQPVTLRAAADLVLLTPLIVFAVGAFAAGVGR